jgi:hypothetical protein
MVMKRYMSFVAGLVIFVSGLSFFSMTAANDNNYIVDAILKKSNITQKDLESTIDSKTLASGTASVALLGVAGMAERGLLPQSAALQRRLLLAIGSVGSAYAAYRFYNQSQDIAPKIEKIKKYVVLCHSLAVAKKTYDKPEDLIKAIFEERNAAWVGKSFIAIHNAIANLIDQGGYALELAELLKEQNNENPLEKPLDRDLVDKLEKKISSYMIHLTENQYMIRDLYQDQFKDYVRTKKEKSESYGQYYGTISKQFSTLKAVSDMGITWAKILGFIKKDKK